ncbi:sensor histidine kinase [Sorangium sp. So ce1097]|uniref:sensor histidine kinase n=1 Tax=Sorangium sp. So ce1097 TaxID=3133330 RepID=UPI003F63FEEE
MAVTQPDAAALLGALLASQDDLLLVVQRGEVTHASAAAVRLLGAAAAPSGDVASVFHESSREKLAAALAHGAAAAWELQVCRAGGGQEAVTFLVVPAADGARILLGRASLRDEAHRREEAAIALTSELADLTRELATKGAELEAARAGLEELGRQREDFMSIVSHDLKSSLNAIRLQATLIEHAQSAPTPAQRAIIAGRLLRNVDRMTALISDILDAALADAGELQIAARRLPLEEVVAEVVDTVAPTAAEAGVQIRRAGVAVVRGDARRLYQVLANLVENAIRHAPRGTDVLVELAGRDGRVRCAVEDAGPGVAPEERAAVFARFRRQGGRAGRAGLGLHIAQRIVALHGGSIWVEAGARGGARFVFELPAFEGAAAGADVDAGAGVDAGADEGAGADGGADEGAGAVGGAAAGGGAGAR